MKKIVFILLIAIMAQGCQKKQPELKSPCVGAENSPCDRRPVNSSMLQA
ncbi:MAG: hypothetical protein H6908_03840 [Hyphomicrobiales bacterium]|nr:hypothetical protein [Hyphomicrobiales bacterium]